MIFFRTFLIFAMVALMSCDLTNYPKSTLADSADHHASVSLDSNKAQLDEFKTRLSNLRERHSANEYVWREIEHRPTEQPDGKYDDVENHLEQVEQMLADYRFRVGELEHALALNEQGIKGREIVIQKLQRQLIESQRDVDQLIAHLVRLESLICAQEMQIAALHDELNRVYYAYGTADELARNGVIDSRKTIWGKTVAGDLKNDLNTKYFAQADKRYLKEIPVLSNRAELLSKHPKESFRFRGDERVEAIEIIDPEQFWKQTDYLAIVVK